MDDLGEAVANSLVQLSISLFVAVLRLVGETPKPCELLLCVLVRSSAVA